MLKIKAFIYRLTGIYLAHREELEYITSREAWKSFVKIFNDPKNDMTPRDVQGLLIGMWQAQNGFIRPYKERKRKKK